MAGEWMPTKRERHLLFWLRRIMRYGVGGGGLVWAMVTDHLSPVIWLVLGAVATATDTFVIAKGLLEAAKKESDFLHSEQEDESKG